MKIIDVKQFSDTEKIYTILVTPQEEVPYGKALPKDMATGSIMKVVGSDIEWTYSREYEEDFVHEGWTSSLSPMEIEDTNLNFQAVAPGGSADVIGESIATALEKNHGFLMKIINGAGHIISSGDTDFRPYMVTEAYYSDSTYTSDLSLGSLCEFRLLIRLASPLATSSEVLYYPAPSYISELYTFGSFYAKSYLNGELLEIGNGVLLPFVVRAEVSNTEH